MQSSFYSRCCLCTHQQSVTSCLKILVISGTSDANRITLCRTSQRFCCHFSDDPLFGFLDANACVAQFISESAFYFRKFARCLNFTSSLLVVCQSSFNLSFGNRPSGCFDWFLFLFVHLFNNWLDLFFGLAFNLLNDWFHWLLLLNHRFNFFGWLSKFANNPS